MIVTSLLFFAWTAAPATHAQTAEQNPGEITVTDPHGHASHATPVARMNATTDKGWMIAVMLGIAKQPECCYAWDHATPEEKVGLKHIHGALGSMATVKVQTFTDPGVSTAQVDCDKMEGFCFPPGDERLKSHKKSRACSADGKSCERKCGDEKPIYGCGSWCCEGKCGCAECPRP